MSGSMCIGGRVTEKVAFVGHLEDQCPQGKWGGKLPESGQKHDNTSSS